MGLLACMLPFALQASEVKTYYGYQKMVELKASSNKFLIKYSDELNFNEFRLLLESHTHLAKNIDSLVNIRPNHATLYFTKSGVGPVVEVGNLTQVDFCKPFYKLNEDAATYTLGLSNRIIVKRKKSYTEEVMLELLNNYPLEIIHGNRWFQNNTYLLKITELEHNGIDLAKTLHETGIFTFVEPDFLAPIHKTHTPNDTYYGDQWYANNTISNSPCGITGLANADLDMANAWDMSTGDDKIRIAIIDDGVELNHPDLDDNLVQGYDATGYGSQGAATVSTDGHGTACAGLAAAEGNNNQGIAGICYDCSIVPIRAFINPPVHFYFSELADAIDWAWSPSGGSADVISCSWNTGAIDPSAVRDAIKNAYQDGRNGLGCIILFSAGNTNHAGLNFQAQDHHTISTGGSNMEDELWHHNPTFTMPDDTINIEDGVYEGTSCGVGTGSSYGDSLDIAAPATGLYTTDRQGSNGYTTGDYNDDFSGTSGSTPLVAGIVGLMLSENPALSAAQVKKLLVENTDQIGNTSWYHNRSDYPLGPWHYNFGYGRANAYKAMDATNNFTFQPEIVSGSSAFCEGASATLHVEGGVRFQWYKDDVALVEDTTNSITITESGDYRAMLYDEYGNTYLSAIQSITVYDAPVVNAGEDLHLPSGGSTMLSGSATGGTPPYNFEWFDLDMGIPYPSNPANVTITAQPHPILFSLEAVDQLGCSGSDTITVITQSQCYPGHTVHTNYTASGGITNISSANWEIVNSIVVPNGEVLNISNSNIIMRPCAEIIVERGGELNISGCTIKGCDGTAWLGISVYGDATDPDRSPMSPHGKLTVTGSTVKDANLAILSGKIDAMTQSFDPNYGGGIITVSTNTFENNATCVALAPYNFNHTAMVSGNTIRHSKVQNGCRTLIMHQVEYLPALLVNNIKDVTVSGNNLYTSHYTSYNGIKMMGALENITIGQNYFRANLHKAVEIQGSGIQSNINVTENDFEDADQYGLFCQNTNDLLVEDNTFGYISTGFYNPMYFKDCHDVDILDNEIRYAEIGLQFYQNLSVVNQSELSDNLFVNNQHAVVLAYSDLPMSLSSNNPSSSNTIDLLMSCNRMYRGGYGIIGTGDIIDQEIYDPYWTIDVDPSNKFNHNITGLPNTYWNILWGSGNHEYLSDYTLGDKNLDCLQPKVYLDGTLFNYSNVQQTSIGYHNSCYSSLLPPPSSIAESADSATSGLQMDIYPNPAQEAFTLEINENSTNKNLQLKLMSTTGQVVWQQNISQAQTQIGTTQLSPGVYLVQLTADDVVLSHRLVIQK